MSMDFGEKHATVIRSRPYSLSIVALDDIQASLCSACVSSARFIVFKGKNAKFDKLRKTQAMLVSLIWFSANKIKGFLII